GTFLWRSLFLGSNAQIGGALRLVEPGGSDYSAFVAQAQANNITYTLPAVNGSAGQVLRVASSPAPTSTAATLEWGAGSSGWSLTGNAGLTDGTDNFFGTTSGVPVRFITSNTERMRLTPAGVLGLGTTTPDANAVLELERTSASFGASGTYTAQRIDYSAGGFGVIHLYGLYADVYGTDDSAIGMHVIARGGNNVAGRFVATGGGLGIHVAQGNVLLSNAGTASELRMAEPSGSGTEYTAFKSQAQANNITYTLPGTNGSAGQVLRVASSPAPTSTAATLEWGSGSSGWSLTGNAGLTDGTDNFFGTTSGVPVRFITSNTERMRLTSAGVLGLGTTTPDANAILELERTSATLNTSGTYTAQRIDYSSQGTGPVITLYGLYTDVYGTDDSAIGMHVIARGGNNV
ncbi:MAG: hypothetical protein JNJ94_04295, partial [Chlorobi bacterium]|nr:hypothetical protein [Chlorobiota bacterium]